jgi:ankyrin repeat protein
MSVRAALMVLSIASLAGAAAARPLTADEQRVLREAPPVVEQNKTPAHLKRFHAATALATKLGAEGNLDALPLLIEVRQMNVLNHYVGAYKLDATPELEATALRYLDDADIGPRVVSMLRRIRSPELFDALLAAMPKGKIDCDYLLRAAATAEVPGADPRMTKLLPEFHPRPALIIARRLSERQYEPAEKPLVELLKRAQLDRNSTLSELSWSVSRFPGNAAINAAARKLVEVARLPDDKSPQRMGLIYSARLDEIPKDGLLCSTPEMRIPLPLGDARSREVKELLRVLTYAPPDSVLDPSIFGPAAIDAFSAEERKEVRAMLDERARAEAMFREIAPENLLYLISRADPRVLKAYLARGADPNAPTRVGERPLVHAARGLNAGAVMLLLQAGADPNSANTDRYGDTALHAVSSHNGTVQPVIDAGVRVMKELVARGADARARNKRGATALQFAAAQRPELVALLLAAGADVRAADVDGTTPLHKAAHGGQRDTVKLLLDRGADVNAEEQGGLTPLLIARDRKDKEMEQLIASRGGRINQAYYLKREAAIRLYGTLRGSGH